MNISEIENECQSLGVPPFKSEYTAYARLFADRYISGQRALYLDCDTLICNSLLELWYTDMEGKPVAAVLDCMNGYANAFLGRNLAAPYYNSGVMLFDYKNWRKKNCLDTVWNSFQRIDIQKTATRGDQDILNHALGDNIKTIPPKYNSMYLTRYFSPNKCYLVLGRNEMEYYDGKLIREAPCIIHYAGRNVLRPWYDDNNILSVEENEVWHRYKTESPWKNFQVLKNNENWVKYMFLRFYLNNNPEILCLLHGILKKQKLRFSVWKDVGRYGK